MPRRSSLIRKYFPALETADSSPWSHRLGVGRRKPDCGGPLGRAGRVVEVEKFAAEASGRNEETARDGREWATSLATEVEAIVSQGE